MTRKPKLYLCRKIGSVPNAWVKLSSEGKIGIALHDGGEAIPRSLARLLAKRILQALEAKK